MNSNSQAWNLTNIRLSHPSLSIVRIAFFLVMLGEILQLYLWRAISFPEWAWLISEVLLPAEILWISLIVIGYKTRLSCILSFVTQQAIYVTLLDFYHYDYVMMAVGAIFLFVPSPRALALDAYTLKERREQQDDVPAWVFMALFLVIELIYFDSLFYKFRNVIWREGLAFWYPAAIPHMSYGILPEFMEIGWLMRAMSYLVFALEITFPLILVRSLTKFYFWLGIGFHFGIAVFFPIPFFGLGMCTLYLIFVDWSRGMPRILIPRQLSTENLVQASRTFSLAQYGWILPALMFTSQMVSISCDEFPGAISTNVCSVNHNIFATSLGLQRHGVYSDGHFTMNSPILRLVAEVAGTKLELPSYTLDGYPAFPQITGRYFVMLNFGVRSDSKPRTQIDSALERYVIAWLRISGITDSDVRVFYKNVAIDLKLDFNYDNDLIRKPWSYGGKLVVREGRLIEKKWEEDLDRARSNSHVYATSGVL